MDERYAPNTPVSFMLDPKYQNAAMLIKPAGSLREARRRAYGHGVRGCWGYVAGDDGTRMGIRINRFWRVARDPLPPPAPTAPEPGA